MLRSKLLLPLLLSFSAIIAFVGWLTSSSIGVLIVSIVLYVGVRQWTTIKPFDAQDLGAWFADQPQTTQLGIVASLITLCGFVVAYRTALANWKKQKQLELRLEAAKDIQKTFSSALRSIHAANSYLHVLIP